MRTAIVMAAVLFLSACGPARMQVRDMRMDSHGEPVDVLIEPYQALGLASTPAIESRNVTVFRGIFPDMLWGEYHPGRIRWNAWCAGESREHFGQLILVGIEPNGYAYQETVFDGKVPMDERCFILSSSADYGYDFLDGREFPINREKFRKDAEYRRKLATDHGTPAENLRSGDLIVGEFSLWNRYQTPKGIMVSPFGEEEVALVAGINPQYTYWDKLIGTGNFSLTMSVVGTLTGLAFDAMRSGAAPTTGWDYNSQLPSRRNMALIIDAVMRNHRQATIEARESFLKESFARDRKGGSQ